MVVLPKPSTAMLMILGGDATAPPVLSHGAFAGAAGAGLGAPFAGGGDRGGAIVGAFVMLHFSFCGQFNAYPRGVSRLTRPQLVFRVQGERNPAS